MKTLALIGCAHIHTPGFVGTINRRDDVNVKLVWDHQADRAEKNAKELSAQTASLESIFSDPEIDGFVICSETDRHEAIVIPAAATGKPVFAEKPLGIGSADGKVMAEALTASGSLFSTGYFMRGSGEMQTLKAHVEAGDFGTITRVRGSNCHSGALGGWFDGEWRWMADVKQAGVGAYGDLGTHSLDLLLWLFGPVASATGVLSMGTARYEGCDETGEGLLKFENGIIGTLAAAWDDITNPVSFLVSGTKGHGMILDGKLHLHFADKEGFDGKSPVETLPGKPAGFDAWLNAVTGDLSGELVTASEAAYRSSVMEAIYKGASSNSWASVD